MYPLLVAKVRQPWNTALLPYQEPAFHSAAMREHLSRPLKRSCSELKWSSDLAALLRAALPPSPAPQNRHAHTHMPGTFKTFFQAADTTHEAKHQSLEPHPGFRGGEFEEVKGQAPGIFLELQSGSAIVHCQGSRSVLKGFSV